MIMFRALYLQNLFQIMKLFCNIIIIIHNIRLWFYENLPVFYVKLITAVDLLNILRNINIERDILLNIEHVKNYVIFISLSSRLFNSKQEISM